VSHAAPASRTALEPRRCPTDDVSELIAAYDDNLRSLIDINAPYRRIRRSNRPCQCWFDAECRAAKRQTSAGTLSTWKSQFSSQRGLFQRKATEYRSTTFASCSSDARQLWNKINKVIKPSTASQFTYSASDLAMHFVGKVDKIRANTASAPPPRVVDRQCASGLSTFRQVTTGEIRRLISQTPCKHCDLDPAPTWLVKRAIDVLAPVIAAVCNASLQSGFFPQSQKLARVTVRLKKPSMDPDDLNSFHPISNIIVGCPGTQSFQLYAKVSFSVPVRVSSCQIRNSKWPPKSKMAANFHLFCRIMPQLFYY